MADNRPRVKDMNGRQRKAWYEIKRATASAQLYGRSAPICSETEGAYFWVRGTRRDGAAYDYVITPWGYINLASSHECSQGTINA